MTKMAALCKQYEMVMEKIYKMAEYTFSRAYIEEKLDEEVISCLILNGFDVDLTGLPTWTGIYWYDSKDELKGKVKLLVNGRPQIVFSYEYLKESNFVPNCDAKKLHELYCSENTQKVKKVTIEAQIKYIKRATKESCVISIPIL